ncbi:SDR family oxidoreductase [Sulfurimonas sp.]|nr:SDR family oxidoreductase [Sulfurimonas sp.]
MKNAIVFSASSGIGYVLCLRLLQEDYTVYGTYNNYSKDVDKLKSLDVKLYKCNLLVDEELDKLISQLKKDVIVWNSLYLLQATMNPIGCLIDLDMKLWEESIKLNFINQIKIIQGLLESRSKDMTSNVVTFAGGGTNSAVKNFSAYTVSKIALIKMMELLYEEYNDTKFTCIGPGWVDTKIHNETILAKESAEEAYIQTVKHIENNIFTPVDDVVNCIMWLENSSKEEVSGRNFSVAYDEWDSELLSKNLVSDPDMYKLRRKGN